MKVTAEESITKDLDWYLGKASLLKYILNGRIEIQVSMPINWNLTTLPEILKESFIEHPKTVHIVSIEEQKWTLN